jgi:hypothetical protein
MDATTLFKIVSTAAPAGWLALILAPRWKYTESVIVSGIIGILCVFYLFLLVTGFQAIKPDSFSSLQNVRLLFSSDMALLAGWVHYLAFDLFVGKYIVKTSQNENIPQGWVVLPLIFTFLFGPMGYLFFIIIRKFHSKNKS